MKTRSEIYNYLSKILNKNVYYSIDEVWDRYSVDPKKSKEYSVYINDVGFFRSTKNWEDIANMLLNTGRLDAVLKKSTQQSK